MPRWKRRCGVDPSGGDHLPLPHAQAMRVHVVYCRLSYNLLRLGDVRDDQQDDCPHKRDGQAFELARLSVVLALNAAAAEGDWGN